MVIARAPVRISFAGGGTDLEAYFARHGGLVVSAAITRYCYAIARPSNDGGIQLTSLDYQHWEAYPAGLLPEVAEPLALPKAAIEWFDRRGLLEQGVDLILASAVPPGTGLGSSSAMAVALVRALAAFSGYDMGVTEVAELACELEIERLGMPIGKQDQYASAFGGLNAIHFEPSGVNVEPIDLPPSLLTELDERLLLFSTGTSRNSAQILQEQRADTRQEKPRVAESLHRLKATAAELREALLADRIDCIGPLLDRGWQQKKQLSTRISSDAIDGWYGLARANGALGGKITGAGGGGFLLLSCDPDRREQLRQAMTAAGLREMAFGFDLSGAQVVAETERPQRELAGLHD